VPLVCEYMRNVGIDVPKPDRHILRILSSERLGFSKFPEKSESESYKKDIFEIFDKLHEITGKTRIEIDYLLWFYCADGHAEFCTEKPKENCEKCIIRYYCNKVKGNC